MEAPFPASLANVVGDLTFAGMPARRAKRSSTRRARKSKPHSVLVVACAPSLKPPDPKDVAVPLRHPLLRLIADVRHVAVESSKQLLGQLHEYSREGYRPELLVIVGHADHRGLRLLPRPEDKTSWHAVASWFASLQPQKALLVGCETGRRPGCATLFGGIRTLQDIFASPFQILPQQSAALVLEIAVLLGADDDILRLIRLGNFVATRGVMLHWKRSDFEAGNEEAEFWELGDDLLEHVRRTAGPIFIPPG